MSAPTPSRDLFRCFVQTYNSHPKYIPSIKHRYVGSGCRRIVNLPHNTTYGIGIENKTSYKLVARIEIGNTVIGTYIIFPHDEVVIKRGTSTDKSFVYVSDKSDIVKQLGIETFIESDISVTIYPEDQSRYTSRGLPSHPPHMYRHGVYACDEDCKISRTTCVKNLPTFIEDNGHMDFVCGHKFPDAVCGGKSFKHGRGPSAPTEGLPPPPTYAVASGQTMSASGTIEGPPFGSTVPDGPPVASTLPKGVRVTTDISPATPKYGKFTGGVNLNLFDKENIEQGLTVLGPPTGQRFPVCEEFPTKGVHRFYFRLALGDPIRNVVYNGSNDDNGSPLGVRPQPYHILGEE